MIRSMLRGLVIAGGAASLPIELSAQSWLTYRGSVDGSFKASCPNFSGTPVPKAGKLRFTFSNSGNDAKTRFVSEWYVEADLNQSPRISSREDKIATDGTASGTQVALLSGGTIAWYGRFRRNSDGTVQADGAIAPEPGDEFGCTGTWNASAAAPPGTRTGAVAGPTTEPAVCAEYRSRLEALYAEAVALVLPGGMSLYDQITTARDLLHHTNRDIAHLKSGTLAGGNLEQLEELRRNAFARIKQLEAVQEQVRTRFAAMAQLKSQASAEGCNFGPDSPGPGGSTIVDDLWDLETDRSPRDPADSDIGVAGVQGRVEVETSGSTGPLLNGTRVPLRYPVTIRTGPSSSVIIQVGPVQKTVRPNSSIRIVPKPSGEPDIIEQGAATVDVQKPGDYRMQTPTANVTVGGTIFTVSYDPATGLTGITVEEGLVTVRPRNSALRGVTLAAGEYVQVDRNAISAVLPALGDPQAIALPTPRPTPVAGLPATPQSGDLTGLWLDDSGGGAVYRVRQVGTRVYWSVDGTSTGSYNNIAFGDISGTTINLRWVDLPGSPTLSGGDLTLRIESNNRLVKISSTANYPPQAWTRQGSLPGTVTAAGPATGGSGITPARTGRYLSVRVNGLVGMVDWTNAPTTGGSWVSIVPLGTPDGSHTNRWSYTENRSAGSYQSGPLDPGAYEARFYADGGYGSLVDRVRFDVGAQAALMTRTAQGQLLRIQVDARSFAILTWSNAPTTDRAWVSVVPAGLAESTNAGRWVYTNSAAAGRYETGPLSVGEYEGRFYGDGGYGKLIERVRFRVQ